MGALHLLRLPEPIGDFLNDLMILAYFLHKGQLGDGEDADQVYRTEPTDMPLAQVLV